MMCWFVMPKGGFGSEKIRLFFGLARGVRRRGERGERREEWEKGARSKAQGAGMAK